MKGPSLPCGTWIAVFTVALLSTAAAAADPEAMLRDLEARSRAAEAGTERLATAVHDGVRAELDRQRDELMRAVRGWTEDIAIDRVAGFDYGSLDELGRAVRAAEENAGRRGVDVERLATYYALTKKVIRDATFEIPERPSLEGDQRFAARLRRWLLVGFGYEKALADERERQMNYKSTLYRRATVAYVRALVASQDDIPPCVPVPGPPITVEGTEVPSFNCEDPMLAHLRAYLNAIRTLQSSEANVVLANFEEVVMEQQLVVDLSAVIPLVGDAVELQAALWGEDLAGRCLSRAERVFTGVMAFLPIVGPKVWKQLQARSPAAREMAEGIGAFLDSIVEYGRTQRFSGMPRHMLEFYREFGHLRANELAKSWGTTVETLDKLRQFLNSRSHLLDDSVRGRMTLWQTMRDATEGRVWLGRLSGNPGMDPAIAARMGKAYQASLARARRTVVDNIVAMQPNMAKRRAATHMVPEHLDAFLEHSARSREIIMVRPISPDATKWLQRGYPAKPMAIKGKSASWGPHAGLIPVEQKFSKLGDPKGAIDLKTIGKYDAEVSRCLRSTPPCAAVADFADERGRTVLVVGDKRPGAKRGAERLVVEDGGKFVDAQTGEAVDALIDARRARPLQVLADPQTGLPYTADYDLLALGRETKTEVPRWLQDRNVFTAEGRQWALDTRARLKALQEAGTPPANAAQMLEEIEEALRPGGFVSRGDVPSFHPTMGYSTEAERHAVGALNASVHRAGFPHKQIIHHGGEYKFVFSPGVDYPHITVIDPDHGLLLIPRCDADCMQQWCRRTGRCPSKRAAAGTGLIDFPLCEEPLVTKNCTPVDPDRLVKDYIHYRRMAGFDLHANRAWGWGHYNPMEGWTMTQFLGQLPPPPKPQATITFPSLTAVGYAWTVTESVATDLGRGVIEWFAGGCTSVDGAESGAIQ